MLKERNKMELTREEARLFTLDYLEEVWSRSKFRDQRFGQFLTNLVTFAGVSSWAIRDEEWPRIILQFGERAGEPGTYRGEVVYEPTAKAKK